VDKIAVIGAGTMGHGIAQAAAAAGFAVSLTDNDPAALERALESIRKSLGRGIERGRVTEEERTATLERLATAPGLETAVRDADLCIEAVVEDLEVKRAVFADLERHAPETAVLATNTSSIPVAGIAGAVADPARVIGMHFFNPVPVMKLVEVVVHEATSDEAKRAALEAAARMGKEAIVVRDSPGFATSRLGLALGLEAMRMLEEGVASAADIDKAMELGYRHPMGPLRLTDLVGLDVRLAIAETLHRELGGEGFRPPEILRKLVGEGKLGRKSGEGFYTWED